MGRGFRGLQIEGPAMLLTELQCRHVVLLAEFPAIDYRPFCTSCERRRDIRGIETREWHTKCADCRYGRWHGQSETTAQEAANRHGTLKPDHHVMVDYLRFPSTYERFRDAYGRSRKVRPYVTASDRNAVRELPTEDESGDKCPF
jgi:hypothetical protein